MERLLSIPLLGLLALPLLGAGRHAGEADKIQAEVTFLNPSGQTTTDSSGITYRVGSWSFHENKVYPSQFWGTFPLYFMGQTMHFQLTLSNTTPLGQKPFRIKIQALHHVLNTDGSLGQQLALPSEWTIEGMLRPGETTSRSFPVFIPIDPNLPSGLDVTKVRIFHLNQGQNSEAGLIKEVSAVWCPPSLKDAP
ncbi:MAG: hypothetical protein HY402_00435 [Elusimicrobia bacterium]|nr:hypothetical protein [Elusimicrobiota bacterium]